MNTLKKHKFCISIKWHENDIGGDVRCICIDYKSESDKREQIKNILNNFKTKPMDIGSHAGEIPYSVSTKIPDFSKRWDFINY